MPKICYFGQQSLASVMGELRVKLNSVGGLRNSSGLLNNANVLLERTCAAPMLQGDGFGFKPLVDKQDVCRDVNLGGFWLRFYRFLDTSFCNT